MLRLFYLYLVINTNLRVNCLFDLNQLPHTIETSQGYSAEKPGIQHLWSSLNSATTSRTDHGNTDTMFGGVRYNEGPENPSPELRFRTVEKSSIDYSRLLKYPPVEGYGQIFKPKRKLRSRLTRNRDQAKAKKMSELSAIGTTRGSHSSAMQTFQPLIRMDGSPSHDPQLTGFNSREEHQQLLKNVPSRDSQVFSQTRDGTNEIEMVLEEPYLEISLKLPSASHRWKFSESPVQVSEPYTCNNLKFLEDPKTDAAKGRGCNLRSNLEAFLGLKISQGMKNKLVIFNRIIEIFISLWTLQSSVARIFELQDIYSLQIKSFETLASILQHKFYATSPEQLLKESSVSRLALLDPYENPILGPNIKGRHIKNQYYRLYFCIYGQNPHQRKKNLLLELITLAMLEDMLKDQPESLYYRDDKRLEFKRAAINHRKVSYGNIPNAGISVYKQPTV